MLTKPRAVWLMLPAAVVDKVLAQLVPLLDKDDIVIDGGNSYYHDDIRRSGELKSTASTMSMSARAAVYLASSAAIA